MSDRPMSHRPSLRGIIGTIGGLFLLGYWLGGGIAAMLGLGIGIGIVLWRESQWRHWKREVDREIEEKARRAQAAFDNEQGRTA